MSKSSCSLADGRVGDAGETLCGPICGALVTDRTYERFHSCTFVDDANVSCKIIHFACPQDGA